MAELGIKTQLPPPDPTVQIQPQLSEALRLAFSPPTGNIPADARGMERVNKFLDRFVSNRGIDELKRTGTLSPTDASQSALRDTLSGASLRGTFPKQTLGEQQQKVAQGSLPLNADPTLITIPDPTGKGPAITGQIVHRFPDGTMDVQFGTPSEGVPALVFRMDQQGNFVGRLADQPEGLQLLDSPNIAKSGRTTTPQPGLDPEAAKLFRGGNK